MTKAEFRVERSRFRFNIRTQIAMMEQLQGCITDDAMWELEAQFSGWLRNHPMFKFRPR